MVFSGRVECERPLRVGGGVGRWVLAALAVVGACSAPDPGEGPLLVDFGDELADTHREVLFNATELELVAVDPAWPTPESVADPATLHGYTVRGRAATSEREVRLELLEALGAAARENDGMVAACFNPRHALIAHHDGRTAELIICFECLTFQVWDGAERVETVDISDTPRGLFDRIFEEHGLSIAPGG